MDTRTKIVSAAGAPRGCTVVTGTFDVVQAEDARELGEIRAGAPDRPLLVVVLPLEEELLAQRARMELVAALRVVDYVVAAGDSEASAVLTRIDPALLVRLEAAHAERRRKLIEQVRKGQAG